MPATKTVLITGCSRGLGRAMVAEFIGHGWNVAGCARTGKVVKELSTVFPDPHLFQACDVANDRKVAAFCEAVIARFGAPDLVLNNAAIVNHNAPLWEIEAAEFDRVIDINVKGAANVMRHILPAMLRRGSGVVVNFSSGWGRSTAAEVAPYCATKWAIEGLSQAVAQETAGKVAIIPLNPGIIDTAMLRISFGEGAAHYPSAEKWAESAVPFLIKLGAKDNGRQATAPG
ncbi:MAG: SDR family NAD(P)-dependent oxidoreductase [Prosthecobacter sp.]|nr:SDR family NAD(P)-dependent oxidoreductase [Prosthecobacter sp.]